MNVAEQPRFSGEFTRDGQVRLYNIGAQSEEDVENRLINMHPGHAVKMLSVKRAVRSEKTEYQ